jgi:hypothetical protein
MSSSFGFLLGRILNENETQNLSRSLLNNVLCCCSLPSDPDFFDFYSPCSDIEISFLLVIFLFFTQKHCLFADKTKKN